MAVLFIRIDTATNESNNLITLKDVHGHEVLKTSICYRMKKKQHSALVGFELMIYL